jgi:uncharacterized protein
VVDSRRAPKRAFAWRKDEPFGAELCELDLAFDRLSAVGVAIGSDPEPYRLEYTLETTTGFVTTRVAVVTRGTSWSRSVDLSRDAEGVWHVAAMAEGTLDLPEPGGEASSFAGALDPDLGLSPLFNSMPVLRHGLHLAPWTHDLLMVWISVPDLALYPSAQRYTHLSAHRVRFESLDPSADFVAEITFDEDGVVFDYPGIANRIS